MARKKNYDTSIINKLAYLVHEEKISRKELAKILGYKHPDYITHLIRGIRRLPEKKQPLLNQFFERATKKVVITLHEIIPGESDKKDDEIREKMTKEAAKLDKQTLKRMVIEAAEEAEAEAGKKGRTPGLYYFKAIVTEEPLSKIEDFYKKSGEKVIGVYRFTSEDVNKLLGALYVQLHEGVNREQYAQRSLSIIRQLEQEGLL